MNKAQKAISYSITAILPFLATGCPVDGHDNSQDNTGLHGGGGTQPGTGNPGLPCPDAHQIEVAEDQKLSDIIQTLTEGQMATLDASSVTDRSGMTLFQNLLHTGPFPLNDPASNTVDYTADPSGHVGYFLRFQQGDKVFGFELYAPFGFQSDEDIAGNLTQLVGTEFNWFGRDYTVAKAVQSGLQLDLTFVAGQLENQDGTYTVDGTNYDVQLDNIAGDQAQYTINGQQTGFLNPGDVVEVVPGKYFAHVGVDQTNNGVFALDADAWALSDENITDAAYGLIKAKHNGQDAESEVRIEGSLGAGVTLNRVTLEVHAESDIYVAEGQHASVELPGTIGVEYEGELPNGNHRVNICGE